MPEDRKYGRITTERGFFPADEPVFLFRAKDALLPTVLALYIELCEMAGSPPEHIEGISHARDSVIAWQREHKHQNPQSRYTAT